MVHQGLRYGMSDGTFASKKDQPKLDIRTLPISYKYNTKSPRHLRSDLLVTLPDGEPPPRPLHLSPVAPNHHQRRFHHVENVLWNNNRECQILCIFISRKDKGWNLSQSHTLWGYRAISIVQGLASGRDLGWAGMDIYVPSSCPAPQPIWPNFLRILPSRMRQAVECKKYMLTQPMSRPPAQPCLSIYLALG